MPFHTGWLNENFPDLIAFIISASVLPLKGGIPDKII